jgi:magnesium-transporting ATPase (P-type)
LKFLSLFFFLFYLSFLSLDSPVVLLSFFFLGLQDPLRPGAAAAVATCQRAGVVVRMVTGDHPTTAAAVAREAGILPRAYCGDVEDRAPAVMTGPYFRTKYQAAIEAVQA